MKSEVFAMKSYKVRGLEDMPKKRSLKDAAGDDLVKKQVKSIPESNSLSSKQRISPDITAKPSKMPLKHSQKVSKRSTSMVVPQRKWIGMAVSVLIGFAGGFFFGRFIKII
jgi:hypothetical protein